ncbi:WbqC family protein [Roseivirga sp. E12]|uniref:WbqC family protein n=1 Tax=Roseivirga sp. E12 TaxID=2819237 RepID=UPI001ABC6101|nr:WbqC family protein [Roseivirga sp. E12]MBO3699265.1 WbqC family protein [Roseivirga sp. E12]
MRILIESQYLPSVAYFVLLSHCEEAFIEGNENFEKQSYRNRCEIIGSNKVQSLSLPVHHGGRKVLIKDLTIDYKQKWSNNHWRAIQSAYGKAPFYDYYADYFESEIKANYSTLYQLNSRLLTLCLKLLKLDVKLAETSEYSKSPPEGLLDFRSHIHPKKSLDSLTWFKPQAYHQIFGKDFVPNMSILDLLFCMGPDALEVLYNSGVMNKNN